MAGRNGLSAETLTALDEALASYRAAFTEPRWQAYLAMHRRRYAFLVERMWELISKLPPDKGVHRILDIGPRFEVDLFRRLLPNVRVDTLGLNEGLFPAGDEERRVVFDLNDADQRWRRPSMGRYDVIVMAEVLEHLKMPPSVVLPWIGSLLVPGGYLLVQTPNAVSLPNRLRMLIGLNPFQFLSADRAYPGHYREYTISELRREGRNAGLEVAQVQAANYFDSDRRLNRLYRLLQQATPATLRSGITIVYRGPLPVGGPSGA